ncbi:Trp biosynthesis-associated membrane protein [Amycolatopsis dongchuanensis]|uniref:Trp biosynthesis-associated membrane protein n=1 Tax=Amycolatopsis TaxID=1813 RepID=UPI0031F8FC90
MTQPTPSKRPLWTLAVLLLLGAAALWGASRLVWSAEQHDRGVRGVVLETHTGAQVQGALVPLAVLAVAGVAGAVATGGWPRRVLGVLLALAGLWACWLAVDGLSFGGFPAGTPGWQIFTGRGLALLGGILVLLGGLIATRKAGSMPRLGARYAAPSVKKTARDPDTELWEALSEGEDPTDR